jgi:RNA polymerase sigma-70 factor (ECF subfamily)
MGGDEEEIRLELALIDRAKAGDTDAYGKLVTLHQDRIFATVLRHVRDEHKARDITQDAFIQAYKAIQSYEDRARFTTWLHRIALNLVTSRHRHESALKRGGGQNRASLDAEGVPEPDAGLRSPDQVVEADEIGVLVRAAIDELEEEYRTVIVLRDLQGMSYEEIADVLDVPAGTVRSRLHRGRERLKDKLKHLE